MRRFAELKEGKLRGIFEADAFPEVHPDFPLVEITDYPEACEGWLFDGVNCSPPEVPVVPLSDVKESQKLAIKVSWKNDIETVGMPTGLGFNVDYDIEDALIWQAGAQFLDPEATEVEVRAIDNTFHSIPVATFLQIPQMQQAYYAQQLQKKWTLQKAVDLCETVEEIEAINWI